jgi:diguanylate cyclase (GGDEF)-like protein
MFFGWSEGKRKTSQRRKRGITMNGKRLDINKFTKAFYLFSLFAGIVGVMFSDIYMKENIRGYVQLSQFKYPLVIVMIFCFILGLSKKNEKLFDKMSMIMIETIVGTVLYVTVINDFDAQIFLVYTIVLVVVIPFLSTKFMTLATISFWMLVTTFLYLKTQNPGIGLPLFFFFMFFPPVLISAVGLEKANLSIKMEKMAMYDQLTDIPNREYTKLLVEEKIESGQPFGFLFIDLDNFKEINDSYGHSEGDRILKSVAACFKRDVRDNDLVGRLCGDEFLIMLINCEYRQDVENVFERIDSGFDVKIGNKDVTYSVGAVMYPSDASDYDEILKKADIAMYKSKAKGKNQICFYDDKCDLYLYVKDKDA